MDGLFELFTWLLAATYRKADRTGNLGIAYYLWLAGIALGSVAAGVLSVWRERGVRQTFVFEIILGGLLGSLVGCVVVWVAVGYQGDRSEAASLLEAGIPRGLQERLPPGQQSYSESAVSNLCSLGTAQEIAHFGEALIDELKKDRQYGTFFSYKEYQDLHRAQSYSEFESVMKRTRYAHCLLCKDVGITYWDMKLHDEIQTLLRSKPRTDDDRQRLQKLLKQRELLAASVSAQLGVNETG